MEIRPLIAALLALSLLASGQTAAVRVNVATSRIVDQTTVKVPSGMTFQVEAGGIFLAPSINGLTVTTSTGTLTVPNGVTFTGPSSSGTAATLAGTETLSGKTLAAPRLANGGFIADANGNEAVIFTTTASAVNEFTLANAATGNAPTITASGGDTNIGINITPKGSGQVTSSGNLVTSGTAQVIAGGNIQSGAIAGTGSGISFGNNAWCVNTGVDKVKWWNSTFNGAPLIQLGGETTSFPAIKRSSTTVAIRLADDSADAPISASIGTFSTSAAIGGGSSVTLTRTGTTTWDPASLANGASEIKTAVTVTGAAVGDPVIAQLTTIVSSNWAVQACVTAANTVEVKITNNTGGTVDLASGTLRVNLLKY